jgi:hypothetical protein
MSGIVETHHRQRKNAVGLPLTTERLKAAVRSVGDDAKKVEQHLKGSGDHPSA